MLEDSNIILIGMCGVGKSTVGVLLAKELGCRFIDTDVFVQVLENKALQQMIDEVGIGAFCKIEEKHVLSIDVNNAVIATGGSVVYSEKAMSHLRTGGVIVHLDLGFEEIEKRVKNLYTRGVVMEKGETLRSLCRKRQPLYRKYAQLTVDCSSKTQEDIVSEITERLKVF
ncbi:MAG: shikimate kinase [Planctomycetota bacterium]|jgi:shikimate kinase|nr:MAG: shikimate kinase [Planctomycetota bacterium]